MSNTSAIDMPDEGPSGAQSSTALDLSSAKQLTGPQRAALFMLKLGEEHGQVIWSELDDDEISTLGKSMASLGNVAPEIVEFVFSDFISNMSISGAVIGNHDSTEEILARFLPPERLAAIMEEIRGPAGRNMWEKLSNVDTGVLANYLKNEYPQTVAVILSKISALHAAEVLRMMPDDFAIEVVQRMLGMEPVQREILEKIETTLRAEFISNLSRKRQGDSHELMATIFNNFDRQTENRFLTLLEDHDRDATDRIRSLMFTFEDLASLDTASAQTVVRQVEKNVMVLAMKGASDAMREFFFNNMSERAGKMMRDDLEVMGPVRLKEVDEAQTTIINLAKSLADRGEIVIAKGGGDDELIY